MVLDVAFVAGGPIALLATIVGVVFNHLIRDNPSLRDASGEHSPADDPEVDHPGQVGTSED